MKSLISKSVFQLLTPSVFGLLLITLMTVTSLTFSSCDKGNASLEMTVTASGGKVSNFQLTIKEGSTTNSVSTNSEGVALFSDLHAGTYTLSWAATRLTFANGNYINTTAGSKEFTISKGKVHTGTVSF